MAISCKGQGYIRTSFTCGVGFGLHKIFVSVEPCVYESNLLSFPAPTCIAHPGVILVHGYWAVHPPPSDLPFYAIHHTILVITISCKGQGYIRTSFTCGVGFGLYKICVC